jgi:hypothetical protein
MPIKINEINKLKRKDRGGKRREERTNYLGTRDGWFAVF